MKITFKGAPEFGDAEIELISEWYWREWNIEKENTKQRLTRKDSDDVLLHALMFSDGTPVTTGGLHRNVNLLKVEPRFNTYSPWLALVCTPPQHRKQGYGYLFCEEIQRQAKMRGFSRIFLFTITAESLYERLGWRLMERVTYKGSDCAVMELEL